jgi:hypothetical protein
MRSLNISIAGSRGSFNSGSLPFPLTRRKKSWLEILRTAGGNHAATTTGTGLKVRSEIDTQSYPPGIKVSDREVAAIDLRRDQFHGDWNYTLHPGTKPQSA